MGNGILSVASAQVPPTLFDVPPAIVGVSLAAPAASTTPPAARAAAPPGGLPGCATPAVTPPSLEALSLHGQRVAHVFSIHFVRDLLADGEGQASLTCARHGIRPCNSIGIATRHLHQAGLIERVSFELSISRGRKGGVERRWKLRDPAAAHAYLARLGAGEVAGGAA